MHPEKGISREEVFERLPAFRSRDLDWRSGRVFGYVYDPGPEVREIGAASRINPEIQKRITGWSIDFMMVATITAIQVSIVYKFMLPIFLIAATAGFLTLLMVSRLYGRSMF